MAFKITKNEIMFVLIVGLLGLIFTSRQWILKLNSYTPFVNFIIYYAIIFIVLFALTKMKIIIHNFTIDKPIQTFGMLLILFSFFAIFNWENGYVAQVTDTQVSPVFLGSEDGVLYYAWTEKLGVTDPDTARIYAFVISPMILTLLGVYLLSKPIKL